MLIYIYLLWNDNVHQYFFISRQSLLGSQISILIHSCINNIDTTCFSGDLASV